MAKRKLSELESSNNGRLLSSKQSTRLAEQKPISPTSPPLPKGKQDIIAVTNTLPLQIYIDQHIPDALLSYHARPTTNNNVSPTKSTRNYTIFCKPAIADPSTSVLDSLPSVGALSNAEQRTCFYLIENTSSLAYASSSRGWRPRAKWTEMLDKDMRYLLVYETGTQDLTQIQQKNATQPASQQEVGKKNGEQLDPVTEILGFLSFMHTYESGMPVLYVYEIHLRDSVRGIGLGRHLLRIVEEVAASSKMRKVMLTVFVSNTHAIDMYKRCGWEVDEDSPAPKVMRSGVVKECDYLIMSKIVPET